MLRQAPKAAQCLVCTRSHQIWVLPPFWTHIPNRQCLFYFQQQHLVTRSPFFVFLLGDGEGFGEGDRTSEARTGNAQQPGEELAAPSYTAPS